MPQMLTGSGRLRSADEGEAVELYAAHRLRLVRLAILLVDDLQTAEDVVQDAFAAFLVRRGELDDRDKALAYLRASVLNGARSKLRRRRTARAYVPPHEVPRDGTSEGALLAEEHREVISAMRRVGARQREVLVLRYWSGLSEAEIAEALGISRGAVKSTASRARPLEVPCTSHHRARFGVLLLAAAATAAVLAVPFVLDGGGAPEHGPAGPASPARPGTAAARRPQR